MLPFFLWKDKINSVIGWRRLWHHLRATNPPREYHKYCIGLQKRTV